MSSDPGAQMTLALHIPDDMATRLHSKKLQAANGEPSEVSCMHWLEGKQSCSMHNTGAAAKI
jgi:hypothetical protein